MSEERAEQLAGWICDLAMFAALIICPFIIWAAF